MDKSWIKTEIRLNERSPLENRWKNTSLLFLLRQTALAVELLHHRDFPMGAAGSESDSERKRRVYIALLALNEIKCRLEEHDLLEVH